MKKIAIASDHGGVVYKNDLKKDLEKEGFIVNDYGTYNEESCDYPDYAIKACNSIVNNENELGVLICGTGIGMSIAANKIDGIRCALVNDPEVSKITREHNNTNVVAMGARVNDYNTIKEIAINFINEPFSNDQRHINRINKVMDIEKK